MGNKKKQSNPAFERLAVELSAASGEVSQGSLFGMPCLKLGKKAFLGAYDGGVVFKLAGAAHATALALTGSVLFDPGGKGRPMRAWVVVGREHEARYSELAAQAAANARA